MIETWINPSMSTYNFEIVYLAKISTLCNVCINIIFLLVLLSLQALRYQVPSNIS